MWRDPETPEPLPLPAGDQIKLLTAIWRSPAVDATAPLSDSQPPQPVSALHKPAAADTGWRKAHAGESQCVDGAHR